MLLMIDVGNTNTVFGVNSLADESKRVFTSWRVASSRERMADEWYALVHPLLESRSIDPAAFYGAIISSVVPAITVALRELLDRHFGITPLIVSHKLDLGISIKTDNPEEVGTDRLVNSAVAFAMFGGPVIVVDLGTATKIEAVTAAGDYLGGVIAPGLGLSLDALASRAARLYAVELRLPQAAIGRNTVNAVQSGVVTGHAAMIEGMVNRVQIELGGANNVILTGGYSSALIRATSVVTDYIPDLTLQGLRYLFDRNSQVPGASMLEIEEMIP